MRRDAMARPSLRPFTAPRAHARSAFHPQSAVKRHFNYKCEIVAFAVSNLVCHRFLWARPRVTRGDINGSIDRPAGSTLQPGPTILAAD